MKEPNNKQISFERSVGQGGEPLKLVEAGRSLVRRKSEEASCAPKPKTVLQLGWGHWRERKTCVDGRAL